MIGLLCVVLTFALELLSGDPWSSSCIIAAVTLLWLLIVQVALHLKIRGLASTVSKPPQQQRVPIQTRGQYTRVPILGDGKVGGLWYGQDSIWYVFECTPTNESLVEYFKVKGFKNWLVWGSIYKVEDTRTITVECEPEDSGCKMSRPLQITNPDGGSHGPLMVKVAEDVLFGPNSVSIKIDMGAAFDAGSAQITGGVNLGLAHGSLTIIFADAGLNTGSVAVGTYAWRCNPAESTTDQNESQGGESEDAGTLEIPVSQFEELTGEVQGCVLLARLEQVAALSIIPVSAWLFNITIASNTVTISANFDGVEFIITSSETITHNGLIGSDCADKNATYSIDATMTAQTGVSVGTVSGSVPVSCPEKMHYKPLKPVVPLAGVPIQIQLNISLFSKCFT